MKLHICIWRQILAAVSSRHLQSDPLLFFHITAGVMCFILVVLGMVPAKNLEKIIPAKSTNGGKNDAQRTYATFIIFAVWDHSFVLSASFALFIH
jgi:hypothetical protein